MATPFEMSDDGAAKYQSTVQLKTQPPLITPGAPNSGNFSERNGGLTSRNTN